MLCAHIYPYNYDFGCIICVPFKKLLLRNVMFIVSRPLLLHPWIGCSGWLLGR